MKCPHCDGDIPGHVRYCPSCSCDVGFPNVRAAQKTDESNALEVRWKKGQDYALQNGTKLVLDSFEKAVSQSKAVLCRSLGVAHWLISSDNVHFGTFWIEVEAGIRSPKDNEFDLARGAVDATFFPYYQKEIRFAALSLNDRGPVAYGACSIVLKEPFVAHRASVCEENTLVFCRRHQIIVGSPPPPGYRAVWSERPRLATAKLYERLEPRTNGVDFPAILNRLRGRIRWILSKCISMVL